MKKMFSKKPNLTKLMGKMMRALPTIELEMETAVIRVDLDMKEVIGI